MWNSSAEILNLFNSTSGLQIAKNHQDEFDLYNSENIIESMMKVDQKFDLASLNLSYTDKMSMMVGVEARVPFLDFELIKIMNSMPKNMKLRGNIQKYILKKSMEPHLPHEIIYRQKAGFSLPLRAWMRESNDLISFYFDEDRIQKQGIFDSKNITKMLEEQQCGKRDHAYTLFSMLSLQIWLDANRNYLYV
jgi:asparagine synthase (glutamine-hydrolysing)